MNYEDYAKKECRLWQRQMLQKSSFVGRFGKSIQSKINQKMPQKVHDVVTESVKRMVQGVLFGAEWTTRREPIQNISLHKREELVREKLKTYKRLAAAEGASTGYGGFLLGLADFPALLIIKMKFLFEVAALYGFDVKDYRERLYLLYIFQIAFSSDEKRWEVFSAVKDWEKTKMDYPSEATHLHQLDWQSFQQEYRDYMDLPKLLQMIPGLGAIVGGIVNFRFLDELGKTAMNAYRMRILDV